MVKKKHKFEERFREEFRDFKSSPSPSVWKALQRKLFISEFFSFTPGKLNIYWTSMFIVASAALIYTLNRKPDQNIPPVPIENQFSTEIQSEQTEPQPHSDSLPIVSEISSPDSIKADVESIQIPEKKITQPPPPKETVKQEIKKVQQKTENPVSITPISDSTTENPSVEKEVKVIPQASSTENVVKAFFIPLSTKGCQPFQLSFINFSENADEYYWDFGDGGSSDKAQPVYIFDEAGIYIVSLTVTSKNNIISRYSTTINVFAPPVANFKPDFQGNPADGDGVYFYNYSSGAVDYIWDFGDGKTSTDKEPQHYYSKEGNYDISLKAISSEGCMDSLILMDAFAESGISINFPSAFSPNMDGPIGGYYEASESNTNVFHPYTDDVPMEYHLKIYNRGAVLLFESNDYRIGWDGYYRQELQPQGVYIYKVRGRYSNGKNFVKTGDVTLLWKRRY